MPETTASLFASSFVIAVPDLEKSAAYFRDALGFTLEWPDGLGWQLASRGAVKVMLGHSPDVSRPASLGDHNYFGYFNTDEVDALYQEFVASGAIILQPPADKPHGMREFTIATPDGHRMMIGQEIS